MDTKRQKNQSNEDHVVTHDEMPNDLILRVGYITYEQSPVDLWNYSSVCKRLRRTFCAETIVAHLRAIENRHKMRIDAGWHLLTINELSTLIRALIYPELLLKNHQFLIDIHDAFYITATAPVHPLSYATNRSDGVALPAKPTFKALPFLGQLVPVVRPTTLNNQDNPLYLGDAQVISHINHHVYSLELGRTDQAGIWEIITTMKLTCRPLDRLHWLILTIKYPTWDLAGEYRFDYADGVYAGQMYSNEPPLRIYFKTEIEEEKAKVLDILKKNTN